MVVAAVKVVWGGEVVEDAFIFLIGFYFVGNKNIIILKQETQFLCGTHILFTLWIQTAFEMSVVYAYINGGFWEEKVDGGGMGNEDGWAEVVMKVGEPISDEG